MKCRIKVNKTLTAVRKTGHTITTADGNVIHKKLASNPLKFPKKPGESRKPTSRCGKISQGDFCQTQKRLISEKLKRDEAGTSKSFPKLPNRDAEERTVITITTDSQTADAEENSTTADEHPEADEITEIDASPPTKVTGRTLTAETPCHPHPSVEAPELAPEPTDGTPRPLR